MHIAILKALEGINYEKADVFNWLICGPYSSDGTNYTQVLSREELVKGRKFWLLPLREEIARAQYALEAQGTDAHQEVLLGMDFVKDVLYRCLELVEELLANVPD